MKLCHYSSTVTIRTGRALYHQMKYNLTKQHMWVFHVDKRWEGWALIEATPLYRHIILMLNLLPSCDVNSLAEEKSCHVHAFGLNKFDFVRRKSDNKVKFENAGGGWFSNELVRERN